MATLEPFRAIELWHKQRVKGWSEDVAWLLNDTGITRAMVEEAASTIAPYARPATPEEVVTLMARLKLHYPDWEAHTEKESRLVALDWIEDLSGEPIGLLFEACGEWRRSSNKHAPTPGQLMTTRRVVKIRSRLSVFLRATEAARQWFADLRNGNEGHWFRSNSLWKEEKRVQDLEEDLAHSREYARQEQLAEDEDAAAGVEVNWQKRKHLWPQRPCGEGRTYWRETAKRDEARLSDAKNRRDIARDLIARAMA